MVFLHKSVVLQEGIIRQVVPALCGGLLTVSFGMAFGWPSLARPYLLNQETSPIKIKHTQIPLVAGFLMEGNALGALFCTTKLLTSKTGVFLSISVQSIGWCVLIGTKDIWGLLVSRILIGFGSGFGVAQLKRYIRETCEPKIADILINYLPLGVNIGIVIVYTIGIFQSLRLTAAYCSCIVFISLISFGLIPKRENFPEKIKSCFTLSTIEMQPEAKMSQQEHEMTFLKALECKNVQRTVYILLVVIFIQQYTGAPANIIFSQRIFIESGIEIPKTCSVIYALFFLLFKALSLTYSIHIHRKTNLIISCLMTIVTTALMASYYYFKDNLLNISHYFVWNPLIILIFYNGFHTFGLSATPTLFITDIAPKNGRNYVHKWQVIHSSISGIISTKIFQLLYVNYSMGAAYTFFSSVAFIGLILILFFIPETKQCSHSHKNSKINISSVVSQRNEVTYL